MFRCGKSFCFLPQRLLQGRVPVPSHRTLFMCGAHSAAGSARGGVARCRCSCALLADDHDGSPPCRRSFRTSMDETFSRPRRSGPTAMLAADLQNHPLSSLSFAVFKQLWPSHSWNIRLRVLLCISFVIITKVTKVAVPVLLKCVVDNLNGAQLGIVRTGLWPRYAQPVRSRAGVRHCALSLRRHF